ncbi:hypothetical protein ACPVPU_10410 [Sphingomonas sp. CJ99]
MTTPIAYFTWEATTDQLRWDEGAPDRLGIARDRLESFDRWSHNWAASDQPALAAMMAAAVRQRPDALSLTVHQTDDQGGVRVLAISGDWVDGLVCGVVQDGVAQALAVMPPTLLTRQFAHDMAQPLVAATNYLAAMDMVVGQQPELSSFAQMVAAARSQLEKAGGLVRDLRARLIEAETG